MFIPWKICYKLKNNNNSICYIPIIFLGYVNKDIKKIFNKIEDYTYVEMLTKLTNKEIKQLQDNYGDFWHTICFMTDHILDQLKNIKANDKATISKKLGKDWINNNIEKIESSSITYSTSHSGLMIGGDVNEEENNFENDNFYDEPDDQVNKDNTDILLNNNEDDETIIEESKVLEWDKNENNEKIKKNIDIIKKINKLSDDDPSISKKSNITLSKDLYLINKSENLKDVYRKQYIFSHFIFDDDTVDKVMNILCKTLNIGDEIVKDGNIIPQRIYMWYKNDNNEFKSLAFRHLLRSEEFTDVTMELPKFIDNFLNSDNYNIINNILKHNILTSESNQFKILDDMKFKFKEIMCTDIYTDINEYYKAYNINSDQIDDLKNIYLKLYYPLINTEIFNNIWKFLSNNYSIENKIIGDYIIDSNNSYSLDYPVRL